MRDLYVMVIMIFLHIFADFTLQGIMASMKQRSWWALQTPDLNRSQYKKDYIQALIAHAFEWSFVVMLPMLIQAWQMEESRLGFRYMGLLAANTLAHAIIDHMKANLKWINLWEDQILHLFQIFVTWVLWPQLFA